jgi:engulfment/cell motility protein 1
MLQGGWFNSGFLMVQGITSHARANNAKPLRFVRLVSALGVLFPHCSDTCSRRIVALWLGMNSPLALRLIRLMKRCEKGVSPTNPRVGEADECVVDVSNITDLRLQTSRAIGSRSPNLVSKLSFSLMSGPELSLLDVDAVHAAQLAEWTDGVRALRGEGGMATKDTAGFVHVSYIQTYR